MSKAPTRPAAARTLERRLLVQLQAGDSVAAVVTAKVGFTFYLVFFLKTMLLQVGRVATSKVCLARSEEKIPAGQQSVLITH